MELHKILNPLPKELTLKNICYICSKQFKNNSTCRRHLKLVHSLPEICLFCNKKIKVAGRIDLKRQHLTRCKPFLEHCRKLKSLNELHFLNHFHLDCFEKIN
jgi:hypothetical protein